MGILVEVKQHRFFAITGGNATRGDNAIIFESKNGQWI